MLRKWGNLLTVVTCNSQPNCCVTFPSSPSCVAFTLIDRLQLRDTTTTSLSCVCVYISSRRNILKFSEPFWCEPMFKVIWKYQKLFRDKNKQQGAFFKKKALEGPSLNCKPVFPTSREDDPPPLVLYLLQEKREKLVCSGVLVHVWTRVVEISTTVNNIAAARSLLLFYY